MDLFEERARETLSKVAPLAERMRPTTLDSFVGQAHILGPGKPFVDIGDFPIVSLITGVLGSALSVPFLHALWKERKTTTGRSKGRR